MASGFRLEAGSVGLIQVPHTSLLAASVLVSSVGELISGCGWLLGEQDVFLLQTVIAFGDVAVAFTERESGSC